MSGWTISGGIFDLDSRETRIGELEKEMEAPGFWDDQDGARETIDRVNTQKEWVEGWTGLSVRVTDLSELFELAEEEKDQDMLEEVEKELREFERDLGDLELRHRLGEKEDRLGAILTIHPGAGGTESADWAQMLMRMYLRWAERRGFQTQILDLMPAETAGIRSVTIEMTGS